MLFFSSLINTIYRGDNDIALFSKLSEVEMQNSLISNCMNLYFPLLFYIIKLINCCFNVSPPVSHKISLNALLIRSKNILGVLMINVNIRRYEKGILKIL